MQRGDSRFAGLPDVTVVGLSHAAVLDFWGFQDYPHDLQTLDLGDRVLDGIATPGHESSSITFYERRTQLPLTGDIVDPGHLFIFSAMGWNGFRASMKRLVRFAEKNPIS